METPRQLGICRQSYHEEVNEVFGGSGPAALDKERHQVSLTKTATLSERSLAGMALMTLAA